MKTYILFFLLILFSQVHAQSTKLLTKQLLKLEETDAWPTISLNGELAEEYQYLNRLNFYSVTYQSDSVVVSGMAVSQKNNPQPQPVIIFNRGGNRYWARLDVMTMIGATAKIAHSGYFVIASNYRDHDEYGGIEIDDVLNLIEVSQDFPNTDTSNIGMMGWSRGAMMTYQAIAKSSRIKTGIVINGAPNLFKILDQRPGLEDHVFGQYIPDYYSKKTEQLTHRSPYFWPEKLNPNGSIYLIAGTQDRFVDYHQSVEMAEKLKLISYNSKLSLFETNHSFEGKRDELNEVMIQWLDQHLKVNETKTY